MWWAAATPMLVMLATVGLERLEAALLEPAPDRPSPSAAADQQFRAPVAGSERQPN
jgi:hypothetical protein